MKTWHQPFHCFSSVTAAYCFVLLGSENLIPKLWDIFGNSIENLKMPNCSTLIKDAEVSAFVNYNTWLAALPLSIPSPGPTQLFPAKSRLNPTPRFSHTKNKWVIGHKVSASPNPLLISLWGLRQGSGCRAKLAADVRMAAVTGRQRRPGGLYWDPSKENTITTHCHHCLPFTWAGFRLPQHTAESVCEHTRPNTQSSCNQIALWTYACSFSLCFPHVVADAHKHTPTCIY